MSTLVSVVVPCYNQGHFLDETLQSVLDQSYSNWECIIVNDGSTDSTDRIAKNWVKRDNRFKYSYKENAGLSSARNTGIKVSKGEFILPLDSDDIIHESFLKKLVPELKNDETLAIVSCFSNFFIDNISNVVYKSKPSGSSYKNLLFENNLIATSLFRKSCWQEVGGYDEKMKNGFEDWEFWVSITKRGHKYKIIEEFLFFYRRTQESMLANTLKNHRIANMEYVFEKHKDFYKENYDNTIQYLFFLINMYHDSENKIKSSFEYKLGKMLSKPLKFFKKLK